MSKGAETGELIRQDAKLVAIVTHKDLTAANETPLHDDTAGYFGVPVACMTVQGLLTYSAWLRPKTCCPREETMG